MNITGMIYIMVFIPGMALVDWVWLLMRILKIVVTVISSVNKLT